MSTNPPAWIERHNRARKSGLVETVDGVEYWFDEATAQAAVDFFPRHLTLTTGRRFAGRPFHLSPWQKNRVVRPFFGWKTPDNTRRYIILYLEVPRKNGKTELAGGIGCLLLVGDAEIGGQIYCMAVNEAQARILFDKATQMVVKSPTLSREITDFKTSLYCEELNAVLKPITSKPVGKQGFDPSGALADELHEWPNGDLYDAIEDGEGAREQPANVLITTAGVRGFGFGWAMHERAKRILSGEEIDPTFLAVIYGAGDDDDWSDPAVWAKANPNLGISVRPDYLRRKYRAAKDNPRLENRFRRFFLNQWTDQAVRWLPMRHWHAGAAGGRGSQEWKEFEERLAGMACYGGLDLASTTDFNALVWVFGDPGDLVDYDEDEEQKEAPRDGSGPVYLLPRLWLPEDRVESKEKLMRVPLREWAAAGAITITPGNVADYRHIKHQVLADCERFDVRGLAIDRWNATQIAVELGEEELAVELFGQGMRDMSPASKAFERVVFGHRLDAGGHPGLSWMAANVAVKPDAAGNIKPDREASPGNIDGIVAGIMGVGLAARTPTERPSVYEERGALVI